MKIDPRSHIPIYLQIADGIRAAVAAGLYRPGEALPSQRALAIEIRVNPNTIQRAYGHLEREGLVYSRRGRGLFVADEGLPAAQAQAQRAVGRAFDEGIRAARSAGMSDQQIRGAFQAAIDRTAITGVDDHEQHSG